MASRLRPPVRHRRGRSLIVVLLMAVALTTVCVLPALAQGPADRGRVAVTHRPIEVRLVADPGALTVAPGERDGVAVRIEDSPAPRRHGGRWAQTWVDVQATWVNGAPRGVRASLRGSGRWWWLVIRVRPGVRSGDYPLELVVHTHNPVRWLRTTVLLHVSDGLLPLRISGDAGTTLGPDTSAPLDIALANDNDVPLRLTSLTASPDHVDDAHAAGCPVVGNYVTTPLAGDVGRVVVPAHGTTTLSASGIPRSEWPTVGMLDTDVPQNGCLEATVTLTYQATATPTS